MSWDVFLTIQNGNPYAQRERERLMERLRILGSEVDKQAKPLTA